MAALAFFEPLRPQHSIRVALEDMLLGTDDDGDNGQTQGRLVLRLREDGAGCSEGWCPGPALLLKCPSSMSCYPGVEEHEGPLMSIQGRTMQSASTLFAFNSEISLITSPFPMI